MVNHIERAYRAWPILVGHASNDEPMTYGELADDLGVHHRAIRYILGVIQDYCLAQMLPPLTILVINGVTRMPGHGFVAWDMDDLDRGRAEVRAFAWQALDNPFTYAADGSTEIELVNQLVNNPDSAARDILGKSKCEGWRRLYSGKPCSKFMKAAVRSAG